MAEHRTGDELDGGRWMSEETYLAVWRVAWFAQEFRVAFRNLDHVLDAMQDTRDAEELGPFHSTVYDPADRTNPWTWGKPRG